MKKTKKIYRNLIIIAIVVYTVITVVNQQKTLNQYEQSSIDLAKQVEEAENYKQELTEKKDSIDSLEFIEQAAREMLDMYYPNETIYVDTGM